MDSVHRAIIDIAVGNLSAGGGVYAQPDAGIMDPAALHLGCMARIQCAHQQGLVFIPGGLDLVNQLPAEVTIYLQIPDPAIGA